MFFFEKVSTRQPHLCHPLFLFLFLSPDHPPTSAWCKKENNTSHIFRSYQKKVFTPLLRNPLRWIHYSLEHWKFVFLNSVAYRSDVSCMAQNAQMKKIQKYFVILTLCCCCTKRWTISSCTIWPSTSFLQYFFSP